MIIQIDSDQYSLYRSIPNSFQVSSILRLETIGNEIGGFRLVEEPVKSPYTRFTNSADNDNPQAWAKEFDLSYWGIFVALDQKDAALGEAAVALNSQVYPIDRFQRPDLAVLWDIRVHPQYRGKGIGKSLFQYAANWARQKGYGQLGVETDSHNVAACRFYQAMGCRLGAIHRFGYAAIPKLKDVAMLLW